jgi:hypothetical protein
MNGFKYHSAEWKKFKMQKCEIQRAQLHSRRDMCDLTSEKPDAATHTQEPAGPPETLDGWARLGGADRAHRQDRNSFTRLTASYCGLG